MLKFGFSINGFIFALMLLIPNITFAKYKPDNYAELSKKENKFLVVLERIGEALTLVSMLIFKDPSVKIITPWVAWLVLSFALMTAYEIYWIRFFKSNLTLCDFYRPLLGLRVAGASLPAMAMLCLGLYSQNGILILSALIFGISHIAIHLEHAAEVYPVSPRKLPAKILSIIVRVLLTLFIIISTTIICARNYNSLSGMINPNTGVDEEAYIELNGAKIYTLIRGNDVTNPVIIWVHGGPASPDTMGIFYLAEELKNDYTVISYNQRGCGRTYYENKKDDPFNESASFAMAIEDLDALVDYACDRFNQEKVFIVGHSYGSYVGSCYANGHPDKVEAYIGVGQMAEGRTVDYAYEDAFSKACEQGDDVTKMKEQYEKYVKEDSIYNLLKLRMLMAPYLKPAKEKNYMISMAISPYAGIEDAMWLFKQLGDVDDFVAINQQLFDYISTYDVSLWGYEYKVPVGTIMGSYDYITPVKAARIWHDKIDAPAKVYREIDGYGHNVPLEDPKEFARTLKEVIEKLHS